MISLRSIASCIGIGNNGNFWVLRHFFGYRTRTFGHFDVHDIGPSTTTGEAGIKSDAPGTISVGKQMRLLRGQHVHMDLIRVGHEDFDNTDLMEIDISVQIARELYARYNIGIGRIRHWHIPKAEAGSYTSLDSECEAIDLIDDWNAPGGGIDCFYVLSATYGKGGGTPKDGDGFYVALVGNVFSGVAFAHELGHYLGLDGSEAAENLMSHAGPPKPPYFLNDWQLDQVREHSALKPGCPV